MKANQTSMNFFWINQTKTYTKSEGLGVVVDYIGLHVWIIALGGIQHRDKIWIFA